MIEPRTIEIVEWTVQDLKPGETTECTFKVKNYGEADTFTAVASDDENFVGEISPAVFQLGKGGTTVVRVKLHTPRDTPELTMDELTFTVRGVGTPGASNYVVARMTAEPPTGMVDLTLTASASPETVATNSEVTYTVTVNNRGALAAGASAIVRLVAKLECTAVDASVVGNTVRVAAATPDADASNNSARVSVRASNPAPSIRDLTVTPSELSPPNHRMVDVVVNYAATDDCGSPATSLSVTSNEPVNGTGDGDTSPGWEIVDAHRVRLRAERSGGGTGRIYTVTVTAADTAGATTSRDVTVRVPKGGK